MPTSVLPCILQANRICLSEQRLTAWRQVGSGHWDRHGKAELKYSHNFFRVLLRHYLGRSRNPIRYQPWNVVSPNRTRPSFPHHCNWSWPETENAVARTRCVSIEIEKHINLPAPNIFGSLFICHAAQVHPVLNRLHPHDRSFKYYLTADPRQDWAQANYG